jgi:ADP-heptose:LPS heptosyltransferase
MLKDLAKKFAARAYLAYARRRDRNDIIDVGEYLSKIATALILPPDQPEHFKTAIRIIDDLRQNFAQTQFYLLTPKACAEMVSLDERVRLISYNIDEIGFHGLPKDTLQQAIRSRHFDMVIDLNLDFNLIATFLCRTSEAKLRICFVHPARDPFYNFQMRAIDSNSLEQKYQSLINYLAVFTNASTPREAMAEAISAL